MTYFVSDIHGEYELFLELLSKIGFSESDEMYVLGDIIDKGKSSVRLLRYISRRPNIRCIIGNHELAFLDFYHSILEESPEDFDEVLRRLGGYFPEDGHLLDWDTVDWLEALPAYIENEDFICVHAGVPIGEGGELLPLSSADVRELVNDRRFKNPTVLHESPKCVLFAHTETAAITGEPRIITYKRGAGEAKSIRDFYKIHLDCGAWHTGVLGCFSLDMLKTIYISMGKGC